MRRNWHLFVIRVFSDQKNQCLKMQMCTERIGENAILMHCHAIVPDIRSSGELENILTTNYRWFSSSVELWEVVCCEIFVVFLKFLLEQLLKLLKLFVINSVTSYYVIGSFPRWKQLGILLLKVVNPSWSGGVEATPPPPTKGFPR